MVACVTPEMIDAARKVVERGPVCNDYLMVAIYRAMYEARPKPPVDEGA